jgi:hypothetical protein
MDVSETHPVVMLLGAVHVEAEERIDHRFFFSKVQADVEMFVRRASNSK